MVACVFVAEVTFLLSRCLATIRGYAYRQTDKWKGFMKYAVEKGSGAIIYIRSFIEIGSGIQKLIGGIQSHTGTREHGDRISLL
jgi:hypothetical protein